MSLTAYSNDTGGFALHANGEAVGWIEGRGVGFRGFGSRGEALAAAITAYEALGRWLARERLEEKHDRPEAEIIIRPDGLREWLLVDGRPIGRLIEPDADASHSVRAFGFELFFPRGVSPVAGLGAAHVIHHALEGRRGRTGDEEQFVGDGSW